MSRWWDNFKSHAYTSSWNALQEAVDKIELEDGTVETSVQELTRLRKAISFIDGLLDALDPELVPISTWDNFHNQPLLLMR